MALAGIVMLAGCKKNNENNNNNSGEAIFKATISQQGGSRTYLDPNGNTGYIKWQAGDAILVDNGQMQKAFTLVAEDVDKTTGGFTTADDDFLLTGDYVAAYPSTAVIDRDANTLSVSIPGAQDGTLADGSNPMLAIAANTDLGFRSLCGGLGVKLTGSGTQVKKVVLSALGGEKLWGDFVVDYTENNPAVTTELTDNAEQQKVTVNCNLTLNADGQAIYFALPVNALEGGFDIEVYDNSNKLILKKRTESALGQVSLNEVKVITWNMAPEGAINGLCSVSPSKKVYFSQGNLQYSNIGSHYVYSGATLPGTWRFAETQYTSIGGLNTNISDTYTGWIDLFGWATSGWPIYNTAGQLVSQYYQPYHYLNNYASEGRVGYGPLVPNSLTGDYHVCDWGVFNSISNGGNWPGLWRTLTKDEWNYVCSGRTNESVSGLFYAKASIVLADNTSVNGGILLPDDWCASIYSLNQCNDPDSDFTTNVIAAADWDVMEAAGAIFLPASGYRYEEGGVVKMKDEGLYCHYWSVTPRVEDESHAYGQDIHGSYSYTNFGERQWGFSVRLVCDFQ